jgi:uncharacterized protein YsxB (DUF464 family)
MIRVTVHKASGSIREMRVTGHGSGTKGSDIVCSAVSAVSQTALCGLLHFGAREVRWRSDNGFLSILVDERAPAERASLLDAILTTAYLGLREIASRYPERVAVDLIEAPGR